MTQHYEAHADQVVAGFRNLIESSESSITEEDGRQLAMLIESAISTSVLEELQKVADRISQLSAEIMRHAERYD